MGGKAVGGGGRIANRPPPSGPRRDSRFDQNSQASKTGLAIDTTSVHSKAQHSNSNQGDDDNQSPKRTASISGNPLNANRTGQSTENRSDQNDSAIPTPRDFVTRNNVGGSGSLPDGNKSMENMAAAQTPVAGNSELLQKVQSATQS